MLPNYLYPEVGVGGGGGNGGGGGYATTYDSSPYVKLLTIPLFMLHCPYTNVMGNDKPGEYMKMAFVQSVAHVIQEPSGYLMRCFTTEETQGIQGHQIRFI